MQVYCLGIPNNVVYFSVPFFLLSKQVVYLDNNIVPIKVKSLCLKEEEKKTIYPKDDDRRVNGQHLCRQILSLFSFTFDSMPQIQIQI